MFTGLIEAVGEVASLSFQGSEGVLRVACPWRKEDFTLGESIAVSGACLTAVRFGDGWFEAELSSETLRRTAFRGLRKGDAVNLERALRAGDRLGGHIVQGHVDGVGRLAGVVSDGKGWTVTVEAPEAVARYLIEKGSVAVDGISLTVASLRGAAFDVAVIPHTWERTTLSRRRPGDEVNLEADLLAKYVERLLLFGREGEASSERPGLTLEFLRKHGYHE